MILLDISRLIWRAQRNAPTGIDRVELAYAEHFVCAEGEPRAYAVLHLFGFLFALSPSAGRRFIEALSARWQGPRRAHPRGQRATAIAIYLGLLTSGWLLGPWLRGRLRTHSGAPIFLVVSHHHVSRGHTIDRIRRRFGARTVCFVHDMIPVDLPEYCKPGEEARRRRLSGNIDRCFDAVITNSESSARSLRTHLDAATDRPLSRAAIRVAPLGVRAFPRPPVVRGPPEARPFFVVLGTIEARKNHLLLLNLWTRLSALMPAPPRLLVIGARGWESEQVVDMLERSRRLRGLVEEHNGLTDAEVGALLGGSRALLLPSFAEGFGLPLAEALASGVPVLCSDLPTLREVGRDVPEYFDPLDLHTWADAVVDYCRPDSTRRAAQLQRLAQWRAPRWADHFSVAEQLFADLVGARVAVPSGSARQQLL